jgi:hypothetical protein
MVILVHLLAMLAALSMAPTVSHSAAAPSAGTDASVDLVLPSGGS